MIDPYSTPRHPKDVSKEAFIYFLFYKEDIVYIGSSLDCLKRVRHHIYDNQKIFDSYSFIRCKKSERLSLEREYIKKYDPLYNNKIIYHPMFVLGRRFGNRLNSFFHQLGIDRSEIEKIKEDYGGSIPSYLHKEVFKYGKRNGYNRKNVKRLVNSPSIISYDDFRHL